MTEVQDRKSKPDDEQSAYEILVASGVWNPVAKDLATEHSLDRIILVCEYVVNNPAFERPGAAVVKGLRSDWVITEEVDSSHVNELIDDARKNKKPSNGGGK